MTKTHTHQQQTTPEQEAATAPDNPFFVAENTIKNAPHENETTTESVVSYTSLSALEKERDEWKEKAYRLAADMENLKKRTVQEVESARNYALQSFARDLLPVADNLARALAAITETTPLSTGVTMVAANLQQTLSKHGIQQVPTEPGQLFNPDHHQVMLQVPSQHPTNAIVAELQPGFTLNGRLLRPAMVSVSNGQAPEETTSN